MCAAPYAFVSAISIDAKPAKNLRYTHFNLQVDKTLKLDTIQLAHAEVAELADALGSGLSSRKGVRVQVPPSALDQEDRIPAVFLILSIGPVEG